MAIKLACPHCDRSYNLADTMAGKTIRCKDCEETFKVKGSNERLMSEDDARRKRSSVSASRSSRYEDDDEEDDRPLKKRKKGAAVPVGLLVGGGVGLLVLIVGVVLLVVLLNGNKLTAENIAKVKPGMTEQEVIGLIGSPKETQSAEPWGKSMSWSNNKDLALAVLFNNEGKVDMVLPLDAGKALGGNPFAGNRLPITSNNPGLPNNLPALNLPPPEFPTQEGGTLTKEKALQIKVGMTEAKVIALLGTPSNRVDIQPSPTQPGLTGKRPANKKVLLFGGGKPTGLEVGLVNGEVFAIDGFGISILDESRLGAQVQKPNPGPDPVVGPKPTGIDPMRLQPKMTEQQVIAQYGQPTKSLDVDAQAAKGIVRLQDLQRPDGSFKPVKVLYYPRAPVAGQVELRFVDGLLYTFEVGPAADPMNPPVNPNPQGLLANAAKVQKGMSEKEVTDLLGKATRTREQTRRQGGVTTVLKTLTFTEGAGKPSVIVRFLNGKVDNVR